MTRVAVLGAGGLPAQLGAEFALGGCSVEWVGAPAPAAGFEAALRLAATHGLAGPADLERARANAAERIGAGDRVALILEAGDEDPAVKAAALAPVATAHPEALVATASPDVALTELAEAAGVGERMMALRYGRPPLLQPVVELLAARDTPPRLLDRVSQLLRAIGKHPVSLRREVPGMAAERIELAVLRECLWLLERGVADAAQIDEIVRDGLARTWVAAGPFEQVAIDGPERMLRADVSVGPVAEASLERLAAASTAAGDPMTARARRDEALASALRAERARLSGAGEP